jgi:hypothetical protein
MNGRCRAACLASGGWLLPWLSVLLVSLSLATAMNYAVTRSFPASDGRPSLGATVAEGHEALPPGRTRYQLGSYCALMVVRSVCEADVDVVP